MILKETYQEAIFNAIKKGSTIIAPDVAAAFVAGAAAQFMQWAVEERNRPWVESRELKSYLIRGAVRDEEGSYPNRETGYGKLDISGTFDVLAGV